MRAVVCTSGACEVSTVPDPAPLPGEVVVAVEACGLCGSDVHAIANRRTAEGQILGHEFAGRVVEVTDGVAGWQVGQAAAVNPLGSCGTCAACLRGLPFECPHHPNLGLTAPGAYAEYVAVPASQLVPLPEDVPVELGAHAEPLAVAMGAIDLAQVGADDAVLVYGVGPIGLNAIMALRSAGVGTIVGAGRSPGRRHAAERLGADVVLDTRETSIRDYVEQTGRRFDAVLECSGAPTAIRDALDVLAKGGTCVAVALSDEVAPVSVMEMIGGAFRIAGSCAFSNSTYRDAVASVAGRQVPAEDLISERVGLDGLPEAVDRLCSPGELVRILVRPGD